MRDRTSQILEAILREFISSGEPVSSERLYEDYDFGIKPAMIRAEMNELTKLGFLDQPHHSAGRIPSNKGYEFYVNLVMKEVEPEPIRNELKDSFEDGDIQELIEELSHDLGVLSVASGRNRKIVYKEGLDMLFENLVWNSANEVRQIIKDFEDIDERLEKIERMTDDFLDVFIGRKSPVTKSDELSVVMGDYMLGGERTFLLAIGPKRMDYRKPLKVFRGLKEVNKEK